jgi:hypothetical protein
MENESYETDPLVQSVQSNQVEVQGCGAAACNPRKRYYRFFGLFFMCFLSFGNYFCSDSPASLQDHFIKDLNINTFTFTQFYSLYSWPNVVTCFAGGYLIDRVFGIRLGAIIFSFMVLSGHMLFAFGALGNSIWLMDMGRVLFG